MKRFFLENYLIIIVVFAGAFLRFFNPLWDNGLFLHPDERLFVNASNLSLPNSLQIFLSTNSPLNPHMFYYGSFLLYLYKGISLISPFSFLMTSRMVSAFFSALTIGIVFAIGKSLFSKKIGVLSSIVFAFAAGSIQYAHFNTTESSLIFLISLITYLDILAVKQRQVKFLFFSLLFTGVAGAIKITGLMFAASPLLAGCVLLKEKISWEKIILQFFAGGLIACICYIFFSPYQFIDWKEFYTQQSYMQAVTYGVFKPPFMIIYENTPAYLYQFLHVFPFVFGFISFPLSLLGIVILGRNVFKQKMTESALLFLFAFPILYFVWSGEWFAKYARYYLLLLPFLSLWTGYALSKMRPWLLYFFLLVICCNGMLFFRIYLNTNTRIDASEWILNHIPSGSVIATEHWDDALPLVLPNGPFVSYHMLTLPVYDPDTTQKIATIATTVSSSDYIILSSRRVYASIMQNENEYPFTNSLYTRLFSNQLGFEKVYTKENYPFIFSDNFADETFQSYDHPPVVIFANKKHLSAHEVFSEITSH